MFFNSLEKRYCFENCPKKLMKKWGRKWGTESAAERPLLIVSQRRAATCDEHAHEQGDPRLDRRGREEDPQDVCHFCIFAHFWVDFCIFAHFWVDFFEVVCQFALDIRTLC